MVYGHFPGRGCAETAGSLKWALALGLILVVPLVLPCSEGQQSARGQSITSGTSRAHQKANEKGKEVEADEKEDKAFNPQSLTVKIARLTPDGWEKTEGVGHFTARNLYEQIDGRAEFYLAYDVVSMTFAGFTKTAAPNQFIELSVFDMGTPTNAFGVFSSERSQGEPALDLGRAGYRSGAHYFVWKGPYYIRIISSSPEKALQRVAMDLARKLNDLLPDSGEPVWGLNALPQLGLIPESVKYFRVDALGLDFMRNTYTAQYRKGDALLTAFLSKRGSSELAEATLDQYAGYARRYGTGAEFITVHGVELLTCNMKGVYDVLFRKGRLVGGIYSAESRSLAVRAAVELWRHLGCE